MGSLLLRFLVVIAACGTCLGLAGCPANVGGETCSADSACPLESKCEGGQCKTCDACGPDESCVRGVCLLHSCGAIACAQGDVCFNDACQDPQCVGKTCGPGERCAEGACYPTSCGAQKCAGAQVCINSRCIEASCVGVTCPANQACAHGSCLPTSCGDIECAPGNVCDNSRCLYPACSGVQCPTGSTCVRGQCTDIRCGDKTCAPGDACVSNACADARCVGVTCTNGQECHDGVCAACTPKEERCGDGLDNDCDGAKDCDDTDCQAQQCDDGDACTVNEVCTAQKTCGSGAAVTCDAPPSSCHEPVGTCFPATGCRYNLKAAGSDCDDGKACTVNSKCTAAGVCEGGTPTVCVSTNPCQESSGSCDMVSGACTFAPKPATTACNADNSACTQNDHCNGSGVCVAGPAVVCQQNNGQCINSTGTCDPANGTCSYAPLTGAACNDGNACTEGDTCTAAGTCQSGPVCPYGNDVCKQRTCQAGACVNVDTTSFICAGFTSARCCNRECVNIEEDPRHCGGCGLSCGTGVCIPITSTPGCGTLPGHTSGRCQCSSGQQCPVGVGGERQLCRTDNPASGVCSPESAAACSVGQSVVPLDQCPDYCTSG